MLQLRLDRFEVDDTPHRPEARAAAIHRQLGLEPSAVPVHDIARALDIADIEERPASAFEGALVTDPERSFGVISINSRAALERRRFSLAHELGHFLCDWHRQTSDDGFRCTRSDMAWPVGDPQHRMQEAEANRFAIELLAPAQFVAPYLRRLPDLDQILAMHATLQISKVAAARRFASLHSGKVAAVFAKNGAFQYVERSEAFPYLPLAPGEPLPGLPSLSLSTTTSEMVEADPTVWKVATMGGELACQVLRQQDGHAIVLLVIDD